MAGNKNIVNLFYFLLPYINFVSVAALFLHCVHIYAIFLIDKCHSGTEISNLLLYIIASRLFHSMKGIIIPHLFL